MKARRYGISAGLVIVAAIASGALLAQAPQAIGTWVSVGDVSSPLTNGASVALPDKRTLIAGGAMADGTLTDAVTIYDSVDDSATAAGTLTSARADHTATLLRDGRVLVVGGTTADGLISSDIEVFDPATGTSVIVALLPEPRNGHVAAALPNGNVLIAGGATVDGTMLQTAVLFDPETSGVSSVPGHLHIARMHASATTMLDGRVLVAGGSNGTADLASAEIYDRYSQSFSMAATQMSVGRQGHSAVLLPDNGGVLVAGGTSNGVAQARVDLFLPAVFPDPFSYGEGEFTATGAMTAARSRAVAGPTSVEGYAFAAAGGAPDVEVYRFATIKTDKDDYAPGELATITGSGWQPNEEVTLLFQEDPAVHDDYVLKVNADFNGNIFWNQWAPEQHDFGVRFYLTATDAKSKAQTTFTDGNKVTFSTSASGIEVTDFGSATANQCVNAYVQERQGNNIDNGSHPARNVSLSSAPAGAAFFTGLNCVTSASVVTIAANTSAIAFSFKIASPSVSQYTINGDAGLNGSNNPSATVTFPAQKMDQVITFGALAGKTYGDADFGVTASASSGLPVTFTASGQCTVTGATVHISGAGSCEVTAHQSGNNQYNAAPDVPRTFTIAKATPVITWANPAAITYGTLLSATQLNATADVAGSFDYTPAAGALLNAGANQTLSVSFTPTDAVNYTGASTTVQITVLKATPVITWATPADIVYGTLLSATQLNATADVEGSFVYTPAAGVKLNAGKDQELLVEFTPTDAANYNDASKTVQINVVYLWDGFLQPINDTAHDLGPMSKFKAGQTIPAKFVLKNAAGAVVQQTGLPTFTRTDRLGGCDSNAALETPEPLPVSVVPLYIWDGAQYHYNWSTKGLQAGLYRIFANLADGTARSVDICLTK